MSRVVNESGKCVICNYYAGEICSNCSMFICGEHMTLVPYPKPTIKAKIFCKRCMKDE